MSPPACFIFGAGPFFGLPVSPAPGDVVFAADGGYRHCQAAGLQPDLLLGDFDSLNDLPKGIPIHTFPVEKDDTDTHHAARLIAGRGFQQALLLGCRLTIEDMEERGVPVHTNTLQARDWLKGRNP